MTTEAIKDTTLIKWIGIVSIPATTEKFMAKDSKEVKFCRIRNDFTDWFLANGGKIEDPTDSQKIHYGNLTKSLVDRLIIEELGGEAKAETTLSEMFVLIKKQANGGDGDLLTNGYQNIFYIKDTYGVLRTVYMYWYDGVWCLDMSPVEGTFS